MKEKMLRKKIKKTVTTTEYRYYISNKQVNIKEFSITTRQHWTVGNKIHWHLDFTFRQDNNTTTNKKALLNLEIIHKFVLAVLSKAKPTYKKSLKLLESTYLIIWKNFYLNYFVILC